MNPQIEYRLRAPITTDDLNALRARSWEGRATTFDWTEAFARSLGWITAHDADRLVGFVNVAWDGTCHAFLLDTTVDPDYQRQGIGTGLVQRSIRLAADAGLEWMHVDSDDLLMKKLYEPCGFKSSEAGVLWLPDVLTAAAW